MLHIFLMSFICHLSPGVPATADRPEDAVQVVGIEIREDQQRKAYAAIEITLRNASTQIITGWGLRLTAVYSDGSSEVKEYNTDEVAFLLPLQRERAWRPAQHRTSKVFVLRSVSGELPREAKVEVRMVALADATAIGDKVEVERFKKGRLELAKHGREQIAAIENALKSAAPAEGLGKILGARGESQGFRSLDPLQQSYILLKNGTPPEKVAEIVKEFKQYYELLDKHAALKEKE